MKRCEIISTVPPLSVRFLGGELTFRGDVVCRHGPLQDILCAIGAEETVRLEAARDGRAVPLLADVAVVDAAGV